MTPRITAAVALLAFLFPLASGVFGAMMEVELVNDGPITIILSSKNEWALPRLD